MHASFAAHVWEADQRISRLSGQRFSDEYRANILKRYGVMIDSGASTLALTAVRLSTPDREFETLKAIQHTRYIEGRNNSDAAVINDVLSGLGLMDIAARFVAPDEELLVANSARIAAGRAEMSRHGVNGVPALIFNTGQREKLVSSSVLYGAPDDLLEVLTTA